MNLSVSVTEEEKQTIDKYCKTNNINRSVFIKNLALSKIKSEEKVFKSHHSKPYKEALRNQERRKNNDF